MSGTTKRKAKQAAVASHLPAGLSPAATPPAAPKPAAVFQCAGLPGESPARTIARASLTPAVGAALTLRELRQDPGLEFNALVAQLDAESEFVDRDLRGCAAEALAPDVFTLDRLFHRLTRMALGAKSLNNLREFLRLGLRAQAQKVRTLEVLSAIQNPRVTAFVQAGQANITSGPQQVSNALPSPARARELENPPSKLLTKEARDGARLELDEKA